MSKALGVPARVVTGAIRLPNVIFRVAATCAGLDVPSRAENLFLGF